MPVFDLGGWPDVHACVPGFRILAIMIYPNDSARRLEFYEACRAGKYLTIWNVPSAWRSPPPQEAIIDVLQARHLGRSDAEIFEGTSKAAAGRGSVAGEVLIKISQMQTQEHNGSVNKACFLLAKGGKAGRQTSGGYPITFTNDNALRDQAWTPYRSVAHLWTAHNLMWNAPYDGRHRPTITWYEDAPDLARFLARAEAYRRWGEHYTPHAQRSPLLPPDEAWSVSAEITIPELEIASPAPLDAWEQEQLRTYRARD